MLFSDTPYDAVNRKCFKLALEQCCRLTQFQLCWQLIPQTRCRDRKSTFSDFSERERVARPSVCRLSSVCLFVVCLSVMLLHPTQVVEIFGNISMAFDTMAIH